MQYQKIDSNSSFPYPNHNINPADKGMDWCMQYARASYWDFNYGIQKSVFSGNGGDYQKWRLYALGKQPITQYKKLLGVDMLTNQTWKSIDWSVRAIIPGYRDKVISKLMKDENAIVATAIDAEAKGKIDAYYNQLKAKLAVRQLMLQSNPQLASHPLISLQSGEPLDMEELEMRVTLGEQFNRSKDAELAIELGFYENDYDTWRKSVYEDLFDWGVSGYWEWLGDDNKAKFERADAENVIISVSKDGNFKDIVHAGQVKPVSLIDLALLKNSDGNPLFTDQEMQEFAGSIAGKFGNPNSVGLGYNQWMKPIDKFKCNVLDIYFYTYNDSAYKSTADENGNVDFRKAEYGRGKKSDKYINKRIRYVYKCSWIVGTDKAYNWGMMEDQKRDNNPKNYANAKLPCKFIATNFYQMKVNSLMERLIPYGDEWQLTMLQIQNFKNRAVPSGWWIDLDALENVALNKGGKNMEPKALLQMFFDSGVLVGRSVDAAGNPRGPNWKPVIPIENTAASELAMFYQDLINIVQNIEKMIGYNDITSGNPNPKTLVPGYEIANANTNDALYQLGFAERKLTESLAADVLCRMKQGIKKGSVSGYAPYKNGLGVNTLRFIELDGDLGNRDYGLELQKKSTEQEKAWILENVNADIANQLLDTSDAIMVIETHNAKQAMQILAFKVKKAKQLQQQNQMQLQAQAGQQNQQSAQVAAQSAQQLAQQEAQLKIQLANIAAQTELQKAQIMAESQERIASQSNAIKHSIGDMVATAKITSTAMQGESNLAKTHLAGEKAKEKQMIANEKEPATAD